ncbi:MAG: SDR family oxidoreductase [Nanoarchaeota archaeon]|nr:SDR family oxidoreductase [Nanoarchaeota archaeon]
MNLKGKIAVITGASTGIGKAIAVEFAKEGAVVILNARSIDGLKQTLKLVKEAGGDGEIFPFDLKDFKAIHNLAQKIKKTWGRVDILANVAGVYHGKDKAYSDINFVDYKIDEILETYGVGITAPTLLTHQLIPLMKPKSKIINISGTFESGAKGWLPYYVSKKALEDLTIGLSEELKDKDIQVNCISPSDTLTEMYKKFFPEYAKEEICIMPEDVGKLAVFFASKEADDITGEIRVIKK